MHMYILLFLSNGIASAYKAAFLLSDEAINCCKKETDVTIGVHSMNKSLMTKANKSLKNKAGFHLQSYTILKPSSIQNVLKTPTTFETAL